MRDDIHKLPLSKSAKRYARMTSKTLGQNWSRKTDMFMDMVASTTGQEKEGFRNRDAAGKVPHSIKGMGEAVAEALLDSTEDVLRQISHAVVEPHRLYSRIKKVYNKIENDYGASDGFAWALRKLGVEEDKSNAISHEIVGFIVRVLDEYRNDVRTVSPFIRNRFRPMVKGMPTEKIEAAEKLLMDIARRYADVEEPVHEGLFRAEGDYYYTTCCVGSTAEKIHAMVDAGHEVSKTEFFKNVPLREVFSSGIAQIYAWTPAQCRAAGVDYEEVRENRGGLKMWNDWAIGYYKSVYDGQECYYFDHSRIEYIFCKA